MYTYLDFKCWEILNCDNLGCLAWSIPDVPCWEIAQSDDTFHNASNTCKDCVVYLIKTSISENGLALLQEIMQQRVRVEKTDTGHQICL